MDNQQAKRILALYRPEVDVPLDPETEAALALARRSPELGAWLSAQLAFHESVRRQLRAIPVPAGLRNRLLSTPDRRRSLLPVAFSPWWAVAAGLVLTLVVFLSLPKGSPEARFSSYRMRMARVALRDYRMSIMTNDLTAIREHLRQNHVRADYVLSPALEKVPGYGGGVLRWRGHAVSMICFEFKPSQPLYLFVLDRGAFPDAPSPGTTQAAVVGKLTTLAWTAGDQTYLLAGETSEERLRGFL